MSQKREKQRRKLERLNSKQIELSRKSNLTKSIGYKALAGVIAFGAVMSPLNTSYAENDTVIEEGLNKTDQEVQYYDINTSISSGIITPSTSIEAGGSTDIYFSVEDGFEIVSITINGVSSPVANKYHGSISLSDINQSYNINVVTKKEYVETPIETPKETETEEEIETPIETPKETETEEKETYNIYTSANYGGSISSASDIKKGESAVIRYKANQGYKIISLMVDGKPVKFMNPSGSISFNNISSNHEIYITFDKIATAENPIKDNNEEDTDTKTPPKNEFHISTKIDNGIITKDSIVNRGESKVIRFKTSEGRTILSVLVDSKDMGMTGTSGYVTFNNIASDHFVDVRTRIIEKISKEQVDKMKEEVVKDNANNNVVIDDATSTVTNKDGEVKEHKAPDSNPEGKKKDIVKSGAYTQDPSLFASLALGLSVIFEKLRRKRK